MTEKLLVFVQKLNVLEKMPYLCVDFQETLKIAKIYTNNKFLKKKLEVILTTLTKMRKKNGSIIIQSPFINETSS
jgi:hypothetical protein